MKQYLTLIAATLLVGACATTDRTRFDVWDVDRDARISATEFNRGYDTVRIDWDRNNDRVFDRNEVAAGVFGWYDVDGDGILDQNEYMRAQAAFGDELGLFADYDANRDVRIQNREFVDRFNRTTVYDRWDVDRSGTLDDTELRTGWFGAADRNRDGFVDRSEWEDWRRTL